MPGRVIVFDMNETLLDLSALDPHFARVFGTPTVRRTWFSQVLQTALIMTLTETYVDFTTICRAALHTVAAQLSAGLTVGDEELILSTLMKLPPHTDVTDNLDRLRRAGLRVALLTNAAPTALEAQLASAGLSSYFERRLSVDLIRRFKPAPEVYLMAARELGVRPVELRLVAAHDWDIKGAMRVGCAGAFVARPGKVLSPLMKPPDIIGSDLYDVTDQILSSET